HDARSLPARDDLLVPVPGQRRGRACLDLREVRLARVARRTPLFCRIDARTTSRERNTSMKRTVLTVALAAALSCSIASVVGLGCSAPETGTHSARDVPDEPSAGAAAASAPSGAPEEQGGPRPLPLADRMRALDKTIYKVGVDGLP